MSERIDLDAQEQEQSESLARIHEWDGEPLMPFSFNRQQTFQRLGVVCEGCDSEKEAAVSLVRLCQIPDLKVVMIRGEKGIGRFLEENGKWAEEHGIGWEPRKKAKTDALLALYHEILNEVFDADRLAPDVKGAPGNE